MQEHNKTYSKYFTTHKTLRETQSPWHPGFTLAMLEYVQTIPTFWDAVTEFTKKNPQYVVNNNAIDFLSNDGGRSYSLCHCKCRSFFPAPEPPLPTLMTPNDPQSGATLKSPIWTCGEVKRTQSTLTTLRLLEASTTRWVSQPNHLGPDLAEIDFFSAGETPWCTLLPLVSFKPKSKFTSSRTSDTSTITLPTVQRVPTGRTENARATRRTTLVGSPLIPPSRVPLT